MERLPQDVMNLICFDTNWITKARKYLSMAYHASIVQIAAIDLNSMLLEEAHPDSKQMAIAERWN